MKPITEDYVNQHLKRATETLTPHKVKDLWEQPIEKAKGDEWYLDGTRPKKRRMSRSITAFSSLAACLAVCFLSLYMVYFRVDATVYLDVNPSVTLEVNCNEKVIRVRTNNPDGEIVLEDTDLKNTDINVAVNAVIGSMVKHGYLTEAKNTVLLSVTSGSEKKTASLRTRLSGEIDDCLTSLVGSSGVFDQEIELDDTLRELAEKYGITPGKAALIQRVVEVNPTLDYDALAGLSMDELAGHLADAGLDLRDYANYTGASFTDDDFDDDFDLDDADDLNTDVNDGDIDEDMRSEDFEDSPDNDIEDPDDVDDRDDDIDEPNDMDPGDSEDLNDVNDAEDSNSDNSDDMDDSEIVSISDDIKDGSGADGDTDDENSLSTFEDDTDYNLKEDVEDEPEYDEAGLSEDTGDAEDIEENEDVEDVSGSDDD